MRPSLDVTRRDSTANSRNSVFTEGSLTFSDGETDVRRRSAIRFELADEPERSKDKMNSGVEVVGQEKNTRKGHKSKDSKSDCAIM